MKRRAKRRGWLFAKKTNASSAYTNYYTPRKRKSIGIFGQLSHLSPETKRGVWSILILTLGVIMFLSLFHLAGKAGEYIDTYIQVIFGFGRWYVPFIFFITSFLLMMPSRKNISGVIILGCVLFILSMNGFVHLVKYREYIYEAAKHGLGGGFVGLALSWPLFKAFGFIAGTIFLFALVIISFFLFLNTSFQTMFLGVRSGFGFLKKSEKAKVEESSQVTPEEDVEVEFSAKNLPVDYDEKKEEEQEDEESPQETEHESIPSRKVFPKIDMPIDLFDNSSVKAKSGDIEANQEIIQKTLANFNIGVEMGEVNVGPTVTQFAVKPSEGIKLSKIVSLSDNLALALAAHPIRIEAPIPGKSLIGIEVPNKSSAVVTLRSMLESNEFNSRKSNLSIAIGKDVKGTPWFGEINKMPHLLIAGSTGSGKSVCINSVIVSLLYQNRPDNLKFIFVDPKRVELPVYNGIPHLLTPVITDTKKTVNALRWAITEMEKRFDKLAEFHKRDIQSYNNDVEEKMPYIVFVIDELADLMAASGPQIEGLIIRLAQMARAVGIHLILATQRPSVDVITGLIKANITARIAFSVASAVDSRTILDSSGAEKLLGRGDMLFTTAELSKPKRLQGAFTSDQDIKRVIEFLKKHGEPDYIEEIVEKSNEGSGFNTGPMGDDDDDPLLPEAKKVIMQAKKASASLFQRRLKVGYSRASRMLDLLEKQGIVGPGDGAKPREVLIQHSSANEPDISDDSDEGEVEEDEK